MHLTARHGMQGIRHAAGVVPRPEHHAHVHTATATAHCHCYCRWGNNLFLARACTHCPVARHAWHGPLPGPWAWLHIKDTCTNRGCRLHEKDVKKDEFPPVTCTAGVAAACALGAPCPPPHHTHTSSVPLLVVMLRRSADTACSWAACGGRPKWLSGRRSVAVTSWRTTPASRPLQGCACVGRGFRG